jgi:hypothetical protein
MSLRGPAYDALTPGTMPGARLSEPAHPQATHADDPQ